MSPSLVQRVLILTIVSGYLVYALPSRRALPLLRLVEISFPNSQLRTEVIIGDQKRRLERIAHEV